MYLVYLKTRIEDKITLAVWIKKMQEQFNTKLNHFEQNEKLLVSNIRIQMFMLNQKLF